MATETTAPQTPEAATPDLDNIPHEGVEQIRAALKTRDEKFHEWSLHKSQAKAAKEEYEFAVSKLENVTRQWANPQKRFELEAPPSEPTGTVEVPTDADAWRGVSLRDVLQDEDLWKLCEDASLYTMGEIADWTAKKEKHLTDIRGVGPARAKRIEDRMEEFWATHRNFTEVQADADDGDEDDGDADDESEDAA